MIMVSLKRKFPTKLHAKRREIRGEKQKEKGRARDRTGIARIRIWSDEPLHYTTVVAE
jgi:hypothetical protein